MADQRGYLKLAFTFPEHPKVEAAGGDAAWLHICALAYCSRNLTDGFLPVSIVSRLSDREHARQLASRLVEVGLWHATAHECVRCVAVPQGTYLIHDYLEHQNSAVRVREISEKRAVAGQRGGQAKAAGGNLPARSQPFVSSKSLADVDVDVEQEKEPKSSPASAAPNADAVDAEPQKKPRTKRPPILEPEAWERFWSIYPRKKDKGAAEKAWNSALRAGTDAKVILDGAEFYVLDCRTKEAQYIKYPASWLNARGWQDEADPTPQAPSAIGVPSVAAAMQPRPFSEIRHEFMPRNQSEPIDFDDAFGRIPE